MTASIIQLPTLRGVAPSLDTDAARSSAHAAARNRTSGRRGHPYPGKSQSQIRSSVVIRWSETPLSHSLTAGKLEGSARVIRCASLTFSARGNAEVSNLCRVFHRDNGNLFLRALQAGKQTARGLFKAFHLLLLILRHGNHHGRRSFVSVQKDFGEVRNV